MPHAAHHDRSALHLDLLAEHLAEIPPSNPAHDLCNAVGSAIHPADSREVRGVTEADREVVSLIGDMISNNFAGLALHETVRASIHCDAIGDVVQRLVRSAVAFRLAGNEHPALEQWDLAGALLFGVRKGSGATAASALASGQRADGAKAICDVFVAVGFGGYIRVDIVDGSTPHLRPTITREPTSHELQALAEGAAGLPIELVSATRGTRCIHHENARFPLWFTVDGDDDEANEVCT